MVGLPNHIGSYVTFYAKQVFAYNIDMVDHIRLKLYICISRNALQVTIIMPSSLRLDMSRDVTLKVHPVHVNIYRKGNPIGLKFTM